MSFGEQEEVEQEMGLIGSVIRGEVGQVGMKCLQLLGCKFQIVAGIGRDDVRCSLVGFVPAAHGGDVRGDCRGAVGQVIRDVLAGVARGHGPVGEEGGGIGGGEVPEPDQVGCQMIQDLGACAWKEDAQRHQLFGVRRRMDAVQEGEKALF